MMWFLSSSLAAPMPRPAESMMRKVLVLADELRESQIEHDEKRRWGTWGPESTKIAAKLCDKTKLMVERSAELVPTELELQDAKDLVWALSEGGDACETRSPEHQALRSAVTNHRDDLTRPAENAERDRRLALAREAFLRGDTRAAANHCVYTLGRCVRMFEPDAAVIDEQRQAASKAGFTRSAHVHNARLADLRSRFDVEVPPVWPFLTRPLDHLVTFDVEVLRADGDCDVFLKGLRNLKWMRGAEKNTNATTTVKLAVDVSCEAETSHDTYTPVVHKEITTTEVVDTATVCHDDTVVELGQREGCYGLHAEYVAKPLPWDPLNVEFRGMVDDHCTIKKFVPGSCSERDIYGERTKTVTITKDARYTTRVKLRVSGGLVVHTDDVHLILPYQKGFQAGAEVPATASNEEREASRIRAWNRMAPQVEKTLTPIFDEKMPRFLYTIPRPDGTANVTVVPLTDEERERGKALACAATSFEPAAEEYLLEEETWNTFASPAGTPEPPPVECTDYWTRVYGSEAPTNWGNAF